MRRRYTFEFHPGRKLGEGSLTIRRHPGPSDAGAFRRWPMWDADPKRDLYQEMAEFLFGATGRSPNLRTRARQLVMRAISTVGPFDTEIET